MFLESALSKLIKIGTLTIHMPDGRVSTFGTGAEPMVSFAIRTRRAKRRLFLNPALALGEGYMDGDINLMDSSLFAVLDFLAMNSMEGGHHPIDKFMEKLRWTRRRLDQFNSLVRSKRNVAHHYDLDGRLYDAILDEDQQYSCAYFPSGHETLEEAQLKKKKHIASKLKLDRPDLEVLDIGCGWGGMAIYLAKEFGARVTGLTLSTEQLNEARQRVLEQGLEGRVEFKLLDYRLWDKPVDRIVSVGMFEHVGINHYNVFFEAVRNMLKPDGVALIHAIGRADGPGSTNPWIAKYIFPGGYSPALSEVTAAVEKSGLWATDIEILRLHYARTLELWRERFNASRPALAAIYDERFCRMFEFYLIGSELAFRRMGHINWQLQLTRRLETLPLSRDYMFESENSARSAPQHKEETGANPPRAIRYPELA